MTSFFRDPSVFDELSAKVLPALIHEHDPDTPIRIWVPGCSTGEEAYSLAIVLAEQIAAAQSDCALQIFATDVDEDALRIARAGAYAESIAHDVIPARLQRFFTHQDHRYTIAKPIRDSVIFAKQNLTTNPPFSNLDLVSCRNVLTDLEPAMQAKVLSLFHFALNPEGFLVLGDDERIGPLEPLFVPVTEQHPIFRRMGESLGQLNIVRRLASELRAAKHDVVTSQYNELRLAHSRDELEKRVADRTRWLVLMHDVARSINEAPTWDEALHSVLRRLCETEHWQMGYVYLPHADKPDRIAPVISCFRDERFQQFHDVSMQQSYARGDRLPGRVFDRNEPFWATDTQTLLAAMPIRAAAATAAGLRAGVAFPVAVSGEVVAVLEIFSDQLHPSSEPLTTLFNNVSDQIGRVLERERATARLADLIWREQQELLHTLHDSLGQTLTGLGMLSTGLSQRLETADAVSANTAAEIARQTQQALDQIRLLTKNLFPAVVDSETLMTALRDLGSATASLHNIDVRLEGQPSKVSHDGKVATELYRIAQEAVTNSVKHAQSNSIAIRLTASSDMTRLTITDDGIGIPQPEPDGGAGLRIMRYRARAIGASLAIKRGTMGGTVVTCTIHQPSRNVTRI